MGCARVAIVLMHGYRYPGHEAAVAALARGIGFTQVSVSHEVGALIRLVGRATPPSPTPICRRSCAVMSTR